jgi:hypothetical protein
VDPSTGYQHAVAKIGEPGTMVVALPVPEEDTGPPAARRGQTIGAATPLPLDGDPFPGTVMGNPPGETVDVHDAAAITSTRGATTDIPRAALFGRFTSTSCLTVAPV